MTDRCAASHAAIQLVNYSWDKTPNELNCHLHPLDSIATKNRAALRECEMGDQGQVWGNYCYASKITVQMNKLRFKDGKGDPQDFKTFPGNEKLPRGLLPRYRGNRLHIYCFIYVGCLFSTTHSSRNIWQTLCPHWDRLKCRCWAY